MFILLKLNYMWQLKYLYLLSKFIVLLQRCLWICFRAVNTESSNINHTFKNQLIFFYSYIVFLEFVSTGSYKTLPDWILFFFIKFLIYRYWEMIYVKDVFFKSALVIYRTSYSLIELIFPHHHNEHIWLNPPFFLRVNIPPHLFLFCKSDYNPLFFCLLFYHFIPKASPKGL